MPTAESIEAAANRRVRILDLIARSVDENGFPPTIAELAAATDVSRKMVHLDLGVLEEAGRIRRLPNAARGISLVRDPA